MYQVRNVLILMLSILSLAYNQAQDTYIKRFVTFDDRFEIANSLVLDDGGIYIESRGDYNGDGCSIINRLSFDGRNIWKKRLINIYGGNANSLLIEGDTLYLGSYETWANVPIQFHFLPMKSQDGELIAHKIFNYDTLAIDGVHSEGIIKFNEFKLIHGEFRAKNGTPMGIIQWIDNDFNPVRTTTYNLPNNFNVNAIQDLQPDGYGSLVFATVFAPPGKVDNLVIRKLDTIGKVIKDVIIPSNTLINERPQFAVTNKGNYVFSHESSELVNIYQLVCSDTSGTILWHHDYPTKIPNVPTNIFHTYEIRQITPTKDDGVIICASIKTNEFGHNHRDAYIGKFDYKGQLEWERKINFLDDRDSLYDQCYLYDIKERPDGKGYIAVGTYTPSDTFTISILLVSLDLDGCIEGLECDDGRIIVGTDDESIDMDHKNKVSVFPNPVTDQLELYSSHNYSVRIISSGGKEVYNSNIKTGQNIIDASNWGNGIYFIILMDKQGILKSKKVIKI